MRKVYIVEKTEVRESSNFNTCHLYNKDIMYLPLDNFHTERIIETPSLDEARLVYKKECETARTLVYNYKKGYDVEADYVELFSIEYDDDGDSDYEYIDGYMEEFYLDDEDDGNE